MSNLYPSEQVACGARQKMKTIATPPFYLERLLTVFNLLEQIAHAFTKPWIPAFAGMTLLLVSWSVMPAQAGIQSLG